MKQFSSSLKPASIEKIKIQVTYSKDGMLAYPVFTIVTRAMAQKQYEYSVTRKLEDFDFLRQWMDEEFSSAVYIPSLLTIEQVKPRMDEPFFLSKRDYELARKGTERFVFARPQQLFLERIIAVPKFRNSFSLWDFLTCKEDELKMARKAFSTDHKDQGVMFNIRRWQRTGKLNVEEEKHSIYVKSIHKGLTDMYEQFKGLCKQHIEMSLMYEELGKNMKIRGNAENEMNLNPECSTIHDHWHSCGDALMNGARKCSVWSLPLRFFVERMAYQMHHLEHAHAFLQRRAQTSAELEILQADLQKNQQAQQKNPTKATTYEVKISLLQAEIKHAQSSLDTIQQELEPEMKRLQHDYYEDVQTILTLFVELQSIYASALAQEMIPHCVFPIDIK